MLEKPKKKLRAEITIMSSQTTKLLLKFQVLNINTLNFDFKLHFHQQ